MSLDLHKIANQIDSMSSGMKAQEADGSERLDAALAELASADGEALEAKRQASERTLTWLVPGIPQDIGQRYPCPTPPSDFAVLATDGSHIDLDRHLPVRCALVNISKVLLRYGSLSNAQLESTPRLYTPDDGLTLIDPDGTREQILDPDLMSVKRSID